MVEDKVINYNEEFKKCLADLKNINTAYKQIPNLLTFSRAIFSPFVSAMFLTGNPIIGLVSTTLLFLTDMIDGKLARKLGVVSKFGADLDAFCDKIMFLGLSVPLIVNNPIVLLNFIFEGIISGINVFGRINKLNTKTVFSGKVKTCFLSVMLGIGYLVQYLNVPVNLLNIFVGLTLFTQNIAIIDYIKEYKRMNKEKNSPEISIELNITEKENNLEEDKNIVNELTNTKEISLNQERYLEYPKYNNIKRLVKKRKRY